MLQVLKNFVPVIKKIVLLRKNILMMEVKHISENFVHFEEDMRGQYTINP